MNTFKNEVLNEIEFFFDYVDQKYTEGYEFYSGAAELFCWSIEKARKGAIAFWKIEKVHRIECFYLKFVSMYEKNGSRALELHVLKDDGAGDEAVFLTEIDSYISFFLMFNLNEIIIRVFNPSDLENCYTTYVKERCNCDGGCAND